MEILDCAQIKKFPKFDGKIPFELITTVLRHKSALYMENHHNTYIKYFCEFHEFLKRINIVRGWLQ